MSFVAFFRSLCGRWRALCTHMLAYVPQYPSHAELTHRCISVTCGGVDHLKYRNTRTSDQNEILHSLIFHVLSLIAVNYVDKMFFRLYFMK